ncbi:hypothetical protein E2C01_002314 [Portunus trituberculatus]|uniref:Uncharacterized protein n=1 Tax=Portunus trituberculatus TaxID=210409 RepID=A0A5B7CJE5_PORTR|nr:hypothetical protein [Portunus trituberculatus]
MKLHQCNLCEMSRVMVMAIELLHDKVEILGFVSFCPRPNFQLLEKQLVKFYEILKRSEVRHSVVSLR